MSWRPNASRGSLSTISFLCLLNTWMFGSSFLKGRIEIEPRILDPVMVYPGDDPDEGPRNVLQILQSNIALVKLPILNGRLDQTLDHPFNLARRRVLQRAGCGFHLIREHEDGRFPGLGSRPWVPEIILADIRVLIIRGISRFLIEEILANMIMQLELKFYQARIIA